MPELPELPAFDRDAELLAAPELPELPVFDRDTELLAAPELPVLPVLLTSPNWVSVRADAAGCIFFIAVSGADAGCVAAGFADPGSPEFRFAAGFAEPGSPEFRFAAGLLPESCD